MTPELALIKLAALLHDPPHKPLVLGRAAGHEAYAAQVRQALSLPDLLDNGRGALARRADHIASAADRPNFPAGVQADFWHAPALSHPLARSRPDQPSVVLLGTLPGPLDLAVLTGSVERAARITRAQAGGDPQRLYLTLWRYFPEYLRAGEADPAANVPPAQRLGLLWHALPADTRVPDHSLWDHLSITAAIAGALPRPAFLVFSLGPVQEFIAQARKTQDLWAGSYLLSYLAWAAMRPLCEELGPDCILYPSLRGQPLVDSWLSDIGVRPPEHYTLPAGSRQIASFPNKFVALVPLQQAAALAERAAAASVSTWCSLAEEVRRYLDQQALAFDDDTWERQIDAQLETHWTVLPWPNPDAVEGDAQVERWLREYLEPWITPEGLRSFWPAFAAYARQGRYAVNAGTLYGPLHKLAQRVFDAAKLARRFEPGSEPGYKCTLCGRRTPALAGGASYGEQREAWARVAQALHAGDLRSEGAERLCAVCLVKRLAVRCSTLSTASDGAPAFPSTSDMAAQPVRQLLIERATDPVLAEALKGFLQDIFEFLPLYNHEAGSPLDAAVPQERTINASVGEVRRALCELDGEWLFPETYARHARAVRHHHDLAEILQEAGRSLGKVLAQVNSPGPSPYYAILLMDGDRMGRWVGGEAHANTLGDLLHPEVRHTLEQDSSWDAALKGVRLFGPSTHAALSSALLTYARYSVPWIIERMHAGRVVYAGGDDVLA
jgi:CRISPR-associated protein Cmr2